MTRYADLTIAEHIALGNRLKVAWGAMADAICAFPKTSPVGQAARRTERALIALASRLDDDVCRLVTRERDPRHLAIRVHYGEPFVADGGPRDPQDAFAGWTQAERFEPVTPPVDDDRETGGEI